MQPARRRAYCINTTSKRDWPRSGTATNLFSTGSQDIVSIPFETITDYLSEQHLQISQHGAELIVRNWIANRHFRESLAEIVKGRTVFLFIHS